ncbi:uncharacterized protein [Triticum aestivum]|uniref:uncharacterized protein n=1 Tax=Triticum aestivum TaxID=4565 RepID=UPI001D011169|nr:uncharacterized protein LOC123054718 [Triticum aestivum]
MFSSTSLSRINNIRAALTNPQKGTQLVAMFFAHMRSLADELAAAGRPLEDDELISYILNGLDMDYQPLVSALDARTIPVTLDELFAQMSNFDQRVALFQGAGTGGGFKSSANIATRGRGGGGSVTVDLLATRARAMVGATAAARKATRAAAADPPPPTIGVGAPAPPTAINHARTLLGAKSVASWDTQQKIAGTNLRMIMMHRPKMKRWPGRLKPHMVLTRTGTSTAEPQTTSPASWKK